MRDLKIHNLIAPETFRSKCAAQSASMRFPIAISFSETPEVHLTIDFASLFSHFNQRFACAESFAQFNLTDTTRR